MTFIVGKIEEIIILNNHYYSYIVNVNLGNNIYHNITTTNEMKIPSIGTLIVIFIGKLGPAILATVNPKTNQHNLLFVLGYCNLGDTIVPKQKTDNNSKQSFMILFLPNAIINHNSNVSSKLTLM